MNDTALALLAIAAGSLFCFAGYHAFRIIIPLWAGLTGFSLGAGVIAATSGDNFLATGLSWPVALACAVAFALLAYLFYEVAVVLAMASIGFSLGASVMVAGDVRWSRLVVLAGVVAGAVLAAVAVITDLPMLLLLVLTALGGASAITSGVMLLVGALNSADFDTDAASAHVDGSGWWFALYLVIAVAGILVQARGSDQLTSPMRGAWPSRHEPRSSG
jgi:Domain of unknown function (DUF4203)